MQDLISRREAIDAIVNKVSGIGLHDNSEVARYGATFRQHEIIDIIESLPSAHSEIEKREEESAQNVPKEDLISRKAAIDALKNERSDWNCDYNVPVDHCIDAIYSVPSAQPEPQWIPCSERLPEPRVDVWVNSDIGQIQGYYEEHIGIWYASFGQGRDYLELIVTAWMPLPEPYSEVKWR